MTPDNPAGSGGVATTETRVSTRREAEAMGQSSDAIVGWGVAFTEDGFDFDASERAEKRLAAEGIGVSLVSHVMPDQPSLAIVITSTMRRAYWGDPVKIDDAIAITRESWTGEIRRALAVYLEEVEAGDEESDMEPHEIEDGDLGWWLFSDVS